MSDDEMKGMSDDERDFKGIVSGDPIIGAVTDQECPQRLDLIGNVDPMIIFPDNVPPWQTQLSGNVAAVMKCTVSRKWTPNWGISRSQKSRYSIQAE